MTLVVDAAGVRVLVSGVAADGLVEDALTLAAQVHRLVVAAQARGEVAVVAAHAAQEAAVDQIGKKECQNMRMADAILQFTSLLANHHVTGKKKVLGDVVGSLVNLLERAVDARQRSIAFPAADLRVLTVQGARNDGLVVSRVENKARLLVIHNLAADAGVLAPQASALTSGTKALGEIAVAASESAAKKAG